MIQIAVKILDKRIKDLMPAYETEGAAGMDIRACIDTTLVLEPQQTAMIPSGISFYIEDPHYAAFLMPRSGLGHKHGIILGNTIGLVDADYQGPLNVSLWNRSQKSFLIEPMDRIAQLVILPVIHAQWAVVDDFSNVSKRAGGGFGSTGK